MGSAGYRITPYRLALKHPWESAADTMAERSGLLVTLADADGTVGYGDCAPLTAFGTESIEDAAAWLRTHCGQLPIDDPLSLLETLPQSIPCPAARCALETALLDLQAKRHGLSLRRLLANGAADVIGMNASIGILDNGALARALSACKEGFGVLKLKIGLAPVESELNALSRLCVLLPARVRLRLDANRAWEEQDARRFIRGLRGLPVESLEEPLRNAHPQQLRSLQGEADFDLALDESLPRLLQTRPPGELPVRRIVLKSVLLGGLLPALRLATAVTGHGINCIVSSSLQSAAGRWADAQLAAAVDALTRPTVHGLATGSWLSRDLAATAPPEGPLAHLGDACGSGFVPLPGIHCPATGES